MEGIKFNVERNFSETCIHVLDECGETIAGIRITLSVNSKDDFEYLFPGYEIDTLESLPLYYIHSFGVYGGQRRKHGVGTQLLKKALELINGEHAFLHVGPVQSTNALTYDELVKFYQKRGFEKRDYYCPSYTTMTINF